MKGVKVEMGADVEEVTKDKAVSDVFSRSNMHVCVLTLVKICIKQVIQL